MFLDCDSNEPDDESWSPQLEQIKPKLTPEAETIYIPPSPPTPPRGRRRRQDPTIDPGLSALYPSLAGLHPGAFGFPSDVLHSPVESLTHSSSAMTEVLGGTRSSPERQALEASSDRDSATHSHAVDSSILEAQAAAALAAEITIPTTAEAREHAKRVDSAQGEVPRSHAPRQKPRSGRATPLKLQTGLSGPASDDTITTSPTLRKHAIPVEEGNAGTLAALQPLSPITNGVPASPQSERLPPCRHLTELADAATQLPQYSRHHSRSFGSTAAPSPGLPYHIAPNPQMSPSSQYAFSARSPTTTLADHYSSPTQFPGSAYYVERRASTIHDGAIAHPPSLPSASSSGDSHGPTGSSTDGYSTSHTTPTDSAVIPDATHRSMPILPPPRGMPQSAAMLLSGFKCKYEGCEAPPFATQYLLSSHKNVHSSVRPHYCSVEGCPRSEAGKGFKRKNEMIRHGLVHNSPGYVCPFCPEREHRYPRPDNLQRHVRVHHAEKDRDDPLLREVLNHRTEGPGKTRRKRANTGPC